MKFAKVMFSQVSVCPQWGVTVQGRGSLSREGGLCPGWSLSGMHPIGHLLLLPPATKLGQGYIFTGICHSVNRGGVCSGGCLLLGGAWWRPPRMATFADSTHPTGMHSCFSLCLPSCKKGKTLSDDKFCDNIARYWQLHCKCQLLRMAILLKVSYKSLFFPTFGQSAKVNGLYAYHWFHFIHKKRVHRNPNKIKYWSQSKNQLRHWEGHFTVQTNQQTSIFTFS